MPLIPIRPHPPLNLTRAVALAALTGLTGLATACADSDRRPVEDADDGSSAPVDGARADSQTADRPGTRTDTIRIEGMAEPMELRLFRTPDGFPLPFSAYVPADMAASADPEEGTAHFTAEFGGMRNEDAFIHVFVFPPGTPLQEAVALARGYEASHGVPADRGIEPVAEPLSHPDTGWAVEAYRFLYQSEREWLAGTIGVGQRGDRFYMIVRHYPQEYGDGFGPRAAVLLDSWRWSDGARLHREGQR